MAQANETIAVKLVASLSKRVTMGQFSFSHPNMRSMILRCRYLGRSNRQGKPGLGLRFMLRNLTQQRNELAMPRLLLSDDLGSKLRKILLHKEKVEQAIAARSIWSSTPVGCLSRSTSLEAKSTAARWPLP